MSPRAMMFLFFKSGILSFIFKAGIIIIASCFFAYSIPSLYYSLGIFENKIIGRILFFSFFGFLPLVKIINLRVPLVFYTVFYVCLIPFSIIFNDILRLQNYDFFSFLFSISLAISASMSSYVIAPFRARSRKAKTMKEVDAMGALDTYQKGQAFEKFICELYKSQGKEAYTTTELRENGKLPPSIQKRGGSGEQGVDVVVYGNKGDITIIQCKHYSSKVSNSAVQEIYGAMNLYDASMAVVITNNYFTKPAIELANSNGVVLVDRDQLSIAIEEFNRKNQN